MRWFPRTLNARLVVVAVLLVLVVGLMVTFATSFAMRSFLTSQLDNDVRDGAQRSQFIGGRGLPRPPGSTDDEGPAPGPVGSLTAYFTDAAGIGFSARRSDDDRLTSKQLTELRTVASDGNVHSVELPGRGKYRVIATGLIVNGTPTTVVSGLPTADLDDSLGSLLRWQLLLTLCGVGVAAIAGDLLVRRTLRPLRQVAESAYAVTGQQLSTGETTISTRVPEELTDPTTEVGQVGSALNTLLDHVDSALASRHRSEQQVRQFVADASHELRTPLATIHGYAELSRRTPDDSEALSLAMGKVETEAHRMSALVEDLLLLARLDAGRPLERHEVDITRLLLEDVADARVLGPEHHWRLDLPDEPVTVVGDEQRLHQVVTNLLGNAWRHTPAGTTVTVSATGGPQPRFVVHDDGPGLSDSLAEHAFERFTRGDSSRTRESGGAGLGLSLVAAIAEAHGGSANVESRPGSTTFTVTLPQDSASIHR